MAGKYDDLNKYLKLAAHAWRQVARDVKLFAGAYCDAVKGFGERAERSFRREYPMFGPREWRKMALIGHGELLPQFFFKSDAFIGSLLRMHGSKMLQDDIVKMSEEGLLFADRGDGPEPVALSDMTRREDAELVRKLEAEDKIPFADRRREMDRMAASDRRKVRSMVLHINRQRASGGSPRWNVIRKDGKTMVRINRACTLGVEDVIRIARRMRIHAVGDVNAK